MVFGFIAAAAAGFLLTATPNWTGAVPWKGTPLLVMVLAWIVGRLAGLVDFGPLAWLAMGADGLFFLLFGIAIAGPMWRAGTAAHRWPPVLMMSALLVADLLVHLEHLEVTAGTLRSGLYLGIDTIIMLGVIIGARLVPRFTQMAFQEQGIPIRITPRPWLEAASLLALLALAITDVAALEEPVNGWAALLSAVIYAVRLAGWHPFRHRVPALLLVLQVGYLWLVIGLGLRAMAILTGFMPVSTAIHALTIGAMASLTLGIMTRVTLAHTGRPPLPPARMVTAFVLISLAALVRVVGVDLLPLESVLFSGLLWIVAFVLFLTFAWPRLTRPRVDGMPG